MFPRVHPILSEGLPLKSVSYSPVERMFLIYPFLFPHVFILDPRKAEISRRSLIVDGPFPSPPWSRTQIDFSQRTKPTLSVSTPLHCPSELVEPHSRLRLGAIRSHLRLLPLGFNGADFLGLSLPRLYL